jgi:hypothetical protein
MFCSGSAQISLCRYIGIPLSASSKGKLRKSPQVWQSRVVSFFSFTQDLRIRLRSGGWAIRWRPHATRFAPARLQQGRLFGRDAVVVVPARAFAAVVSSEIAGAKAREWMFVSAAMNGRSSTCRAAPFDFAQGRLLAPRQRRFD